MESGRGYERSYETYQIVVHVAGIVLTCESVVSGVYPVMRKWSLGVGMREAMRPIRSLFM